MTWVKRPFSTPRQGFGVKLDHLVEGSKLQLAIQHFIDSAEDGAAEFLRIAQAGAGAAERAPFYDFLPSQSQRRLSTTAIWRSSVSLMIACFPSAEAPIQNGDVGKLVRLTTCFLAGS